MEGLPKIQHLTAAERTKKTTKSIIRPPSRMLQITPFVVFSTFVFQIFLRY